MRTPSSFVGERGAGGGEGEGGEGGANLHDNGRVWIEIRQVTPGGFLPIKRILGEREGGRSSEENGEKK